MNNWKNLADNSRVWLYGANRKLSDSECTEIEDLLDGFCDQWAAHGDKLDCGFQILYNQLIVLAVDEASAKASGCSIDTSVQVFREIDNRYNLDLFNRLRSYHMEDDAITSLSTANISEALTAGNLSAESAFVDPMIATMGEVRNNLTKPISDMWLKKYL